jgi:tRNA modification GTPase
MSFPSATICAIATPAGTGALGIIRVSGPSALALLRRLSSREKFLPYRLHHTTLAYPAPTDVLDEVMACYMPGPRSFTGEDVVELYAHGGPLGLGRLLAALQMLGARAAEPGEFTRRAFLNGRLDLAQAGAVAQIIGARSETALRNAQAVLSGELGHKIRVLRKQVIQLAASLEVSIDFSDEVELQMSTEQGLAQCQQIKKETANLAATYQRGRHLSGATVGIVGRVNAGKSSLFNQLLGRSRALVSAEPGTTRDYLEAEASWSGYRIVLIDSVGQRAASQLTALEQAGQELTYPVLMQCDLLLQVVDLSSPAPFDQLLEVERPSLVVANKQDLAAAGAQEALTRRLGEQIICTSALQGQGLEELKKAILQRLFPAGLEQESVQITQLRHWEVLQRALGRLTEVEESLHAQQAPELVVEHVREVLETLGEITGETYTEAILDEVFREFCIGK